MVNSVCGIRSTGKICTDLSRTLEAQGHVVKIAYGRGIVPEEYEKYAVKIGSDLSIRFHGLIARLFDKSGFGSKKATRQFIEWMRKFDPDVIHLHNLHGYYINIEILFDYLRTCNKKIIWTLHDCWAFTGHAAFCEGANCNMWVNGCHDCPKTRDYPLSFLDKSKANWKKKKTIFNGIPNLTIVTPSKWLASLTMKSFLNHYPITVIYNEIDYGVFNPKSKEIKGLLGLNDKIIVLGVAAVWTKRKGIDDFIDLAKILPDDYRIVLVGVSDSQKKMLPANIIGIDRTHSGNELAELYSMADVFVNPTYEDNYPTTNLESIACGTPVITYNTGGSPESAAYYGKVVEKGDIEALAKEIINMSFDDNRYPHIFGNGIWLNQYCRLYDSDNNEE